MSANQKLPFWHAWSELLQAVFLRGGWLILLFSLCSEIIDDLINFLLSQMLSGSDTTPKLLALGALALLNAILWPFLSVFVILYAIRNTRFTYFTEPPRLFISKYFSQLLIELVRVLGKTLTWSLLLVVPGLIRLLQLMFVPFVVVFDAPYAKGEVDAMDKSTQLTKGYLLLLTAVYLTLNVMPRCLGFLWAQMSFFSQKNPTPIILGGLLSTLVSITFFTFLYLLFEKKLPPSDSLFPEPIMIAKTNDRGENA